MQRLFLLFIFWTTSLLALETDFDCLVVGTSPTSMFEALYQSALGKKVVVVEQASECGGAWKSIQICGIPHADMGCHEFGNAAPVKQFLEEYAGCKIIPNAPIFQKPEGNWGFYPSEGCYELINHLEFLMQHLGTVLLLNSKLESIFFDTNNRVVEATINGRRYLTSKIIVTNGADLNIENPHLQMMKERPHKIKYPHIYLLIGDPGESRFTYTSMNIEGASRAMNLTQFVGLEGSGMQLIAIQVQGEQYLNSGERIFNHFKRQNLLDQGAEILQIDHYIFEQTVCNFSKLQPLTGSLLEFLPTGHISLIGNYISKWKKAMKPWNEIVNR